MNGMKRALAPLAALALLTGCSGDGVEAQKDALDEAWEEVPAAYEETFCQTFSPDEDDGWSNAQMWVGSDTAEISEAAHEEWHAETC